MEDSIKINRAELLQQVAALTKENEELKSILAGAMGGRTPADDEVERLREERKELAEALRHRLQRYDGFASYSHEREFIQSLLSKFEV